MRRYFAAMADYHQIYRIWNRFEELCDQLMCQIQVSFVFQICHFCLNLGLLCDLLWSDPDKDVQGWGENDRGVSFTFGPDVVAKFLNRHDLDLICRAHQVSFCMFKFKLFIGCRRWLRILCKTPTCNTFFCSQLLW